jgi:hypothetical protein
MNKDLQKSFDLLHLDENLASLAVKSNIEKSFEALYVGNTVSKDDINILEKSLDTGKLIKKKVQIHASNGKVYEGYRWVSSETGMPANVEKESKEVSEFKSKKKKEASTAKKPEEKAKVEEAQDKDFAGKIKEIIEGEGGKASMLRDLSALGIYDPSLIMQLVPSAGKSSIDYYLKETGIDYKQFQDNVEKNINIGMGNTKVDKDSPVHELQSEVNNKDLYKILKDKKLERAKTLGITAKDKFDAYRFKLDQIIGDRNARSLIVYGTGGIGKTFNLEKKLGEYGKIGYDPELDLQASEYDYVTITGNTTPTDLYNTMFENQKKLLVFDDCDSLWDDQTMTNLLKGALDTTGNNLIHYGNPKKLPDGTYPPKSFKFGGQCIFISNLPREKLAKFAAPLIDSRSNALDLTMSMDQMLEMLDDIKYSFKYKDADGNELEVPKADRDDIIKVLHDLKDDLRIEQVNGRTLGNLSALKLGMTKRGIKNYESFKRQTMISLDLV